MNSMIKDYETNLETHSCNCGESRLFSSMVDTKIQCSCLFFLGDDFPKIEAPKNDIHYCTNGELIYQYSIVTVLYSMVVYSGECFVKMDQMIKMNLAASINSMLICGSMCCNSSV